MRDDTGALKALAMEARLLGEDSSAVDAVLAPAKTYRRNRSASRDTAETTPRAKPLDIKETKEELARRGISTAGVLDKDELIGLLERAKSSATAGANDGFYSDRTYGEVPFHRGRSAPSTPKEAHSNVDGIPFNSKPPVGPRPRVTLRPGMPIPPGMPPPAMPSAGEDATVTTPRRSRRPPNPSAWTQAYSSASSSEAGTASQPSRPPAASLKPQSYDDASGGVHSGGSQRSARPSSASARPSSYTEASPAEATTPKRRPSSASARTPVQGMPVQGSSASLRGTLGPSGWEHPSSHRPGRPASASASAKPPPYAETRSGEPGASPHPARFSSPSAKPPSSTQGVTGETATPQRRPSSASLGGRQRPPSSSQADTGDPRTPGPSSNMWTPNGHDHRSSRPSSTSGPTPSHPECGTPQRPARPSSAPRGQEAASPRRSSQEAASPSYARGFSTPSSPRTGERRHSKRTFSMPPRPDYMPPRPPPHSPRPTTPPRASAPPPHRATTPTREAALTCLGLKGNPTGEEIRRAYKQAALQCHPDRPQNHGCAEEAKANFQEMKSAFDFLQAPERCMAAAAGGS